MKLPKSIAEWWPLALITGLLSAIGWFGTQIVHAVAEPFWKHIAPAIPQTLLLSLCCLLSLIVILAAIWIVYLYVAHREPTAAEKEKQIEDRFDKFDKRLGVWTHKTQSGFFCTKCKALHLESPLRERPDGWRCMVCEKTYENPDYHKPPQATGTRKGKWDVLGK